MNINKHTAHFVEELSRIGFSSKTIETYRSNIAMFFSTQEKVHPMHINEDDIRKYLSRYTEQNSQRSAHSAIKKFYEVCMLQPEKFKYIPYAKKSKKLPIVLSEDEVQKMFNVCTNIKHKAIFAVMYACGLRVSEVINLKLSHIDSSRMVINIIQAKGKKDRQVMLPQMLLDMLREYYKAYKPQEYLFNGQFGGKYSQSSINSMLKSLAVAAGIKNKKVHAHLIRHCCFTHMLERGTDLRIIQKVAGHENVKTTEGYTHISNNLIAKTYSPLTNIQL